ncbi:hypothetical protein [Bradyrhizobium diazoefficiens]|uniref:hypothetical protein n=1 Tax=Bradyrhizobium diazoefficiens TaxID=1355477 RepID=UPI00272AB15D|nr:hypothetical protein [Bradyrhizobium diazoefficiens]WLA57221.1 hypothetical protein QIH81_00315 [Bradyrhizobium diazoefficiens]
MIFIGYLISIILFAFAAVIIVASWDTLLAAPKLDLKSLLTLVQAALAFIGAITAAILTATVGRSNEYLKARLTQSVNEATTRLNAELAQSVNASTERLRAELTASVNESTQLLQAELTRSGDVFRAELDQLVPRRYEAYHAIWAALTQYFRAVQKFEAGIFDEGTLKAADKACDDASAHTLLVDQIDRDTFHALWQELTRLREIAEEKRDLPDGLRTLWRNEGRMLGQHYQEVRERLANHLLA